ncbi:TolC family protein [Gaoshiqia sediminis]|uniref:TolC family protein n=1 Tax=Gaoshiqia sediminis TaxID=2986998 RepID=A0AA41Y2Q2_9BACT|nr:TolC family protein [Gaoshiqia sediminis]MCW0482354.1 TolC family protein [Gaoshiqia sediminis]
MKTSQTKIFLIGLLLLVVLVPGSAQTTDWTLEDCINYALSRNIQVQQAELSTDRNQLYTEQAKAAMLPSLSGSVRQNFNWNKDIDSQTGEFGSLDGSNSTSYSLTSSMVLFNGMKVNNQLKQSELELQSSRYYSETVKESVELNILNAFLQVLYAQENVVNAEKQIEATAEQLSLAEERLNLGMVSQSDYLQIKAQLASEKLTLANANSQLSIARVSLMQLMELPVDERFGVSSPGLGQLLNQNLTPDAGEVYAQALAIKPQIKKAELDKQSAELDEKIAKASLLPSLSLDAGLGTAYSSGLGGFNYADQLKNQISPSLGLSLTVPIFQKKQAKTSVSVAQIGIATAELEEINTKNQLRKEIEQATVDVVAAQSEYEASLEQYQAIDESNQVATEKFHLGLMNSVDYLFEKTNLIKAESKLLQSKYNLIFTYKILDFYKGIPLTL